MESAGDDDSTFRQDDLRLRTCSMLLKALPSRDISLFDRATPSIRSKQDKLSMATLHKFAFLLTSFREVVAVMPVKVAQRYSLFVASSMAGSDRLRSQPIIVCRNARLDEDKSIESKAPIFTKWAKVPEDAKGTSIDAYMAANWLSLLWEQHVAFFHYLAHVALQDSTKLQHFEGYCLITSYRKNKTRLSQTPPGNSPKFIELIRQICAMSLEDVDLPEDIEPPYPGNVSTLRQFFLHSDIEAIHELAEKAFTSQERKRLFANLIIYNSHINLDAPINKKADARRMLKEFCVVFQIALDRVEREYEEVTNQPSSQQLTALRFVLISLGNFFVAVLHTSKLLSWLLKGWLSGILKQKYSEMEGKMAPEQKFEEDEESWEQDEEEGAGDLDDAYSTDLPDRVFRWLRLAFATSKYARDIAKLDANQFGEFCLVGTLVSDGEMENWRETVREIYRRFGVEPSKAETVISKIQHQAHSGGEDEKRWLSFARKSKPKFDGVPHCEAVLAALHLAARIGDELPNPLLKHSLNFIGPSKPCCPICAITIEEINSELKSCRQLEIPILFQHTVPCATSFPPGLPAAVRQRILSRVLLKLYVSLENFAQKERTGSHLSQQSHPLSESGLLSPTSRTFATMESFIFKE